MRHTPLNQFLHKVRHQGVALYRNARHMGGVIDRHVQFAAQVYGHAIQPALRSAGYDTRAADSVLKQNYDLYNTYAQNLNDGVEVIDGIARHLRGGSYHYHH